MNDNHVNYPRWNSQVYPNEQSVRTFSEKGNLYLYEDEGRILAAIAMDEIPQGNYRKVQWGRNLPEGSYVTMHALAVDPEFIVCDEPVSALDVSIQAQILNLLQDLQDQRGLTYMFITHNLSVVKHISHSILVMYLGCEVEMCPSKELFKRPLHPYTKGLLSAIPIPSIHVEREEIIMKGEVTSPINPKPGCRFASRCPYAKERCHTEQPPLDEVLPNHFVSCHYVREINDL